MVHQPDDHLRNWSILPKRRTSWKRTKTHVGGAVWARWKVCWAGWLRLAEDKANGQVGGAPRSKRFIWLVRLRLARSSRAWAWERTSTWLISYYSPTRLSHQTFSTSRPRTFLIGHLMFSNAYISGFRIDREHHEPFECSSDRSSIQASSRPFVALEVLYFSTQSTSRFGGLHMVLFETWAAIYLQKTQFCKIKEVFKMFKQGKRRVYDQPFGARG